MVISATREPTARERSAALEQVRVGHWAEYYEMKVEALPTRTH